MRKIGIKKKKKTQKQFHRSLSNDDTNNKDHLQWKRIIYQVQIETYFKD